MGFDSLNGMYWATDLRPSPPHPANTQGAHDRTLVAVEKIHIFGDDQCDQIGQFFKVLGDKSTFKSCPIVWRLLRLI